jgi:hypothetical protein
MPGPDPGVRRWAVELAGDDRQHPNVSDTMWTIRTVPSSAVMSTRNGMIRRRASAVSLSGSLRRPTATM